MTAAIRTTPRGDRAMGFAPWLVGLPAAWLAPPFLGLAVLLPLGLLDRLIGPIPTLSAMGGSAALVMLSMPVAALWLVPLALVTWLLLRMGVAGWASLLITGAACGGAVILMIPGTSALFGMMMGSLNGLVLWFVFSRMRPEIFTNH